MHIKYISWIPGTLGLQEEEVVLPERVKTLSDLYDLLAERGNAYGTVFRHKNVLFASRASQVIPLLASIQDTDNITLFSPIAGG